DAEVEVLGVNHAEIGQHLAARWSLPEILRESVGCHHDPQEAQTHGALAAVVSVADAIARRLGVGNGGGADPVVTDATLSLCGLDAQRLDAITSELRDLLEQQVSEVTAEH
ncbi:MAG: HDOD domain-containing protein, partial [bacterium]|nr:HDOD domain-containing protein [bacterium]